MTIQDTFKIREQGRTGTTGTQTSVTSRTSTQTLLAANTNRRGATLYNDSAASCYVKLGADVSTTSFSIKMVAQSYYEVPFSYTGVIEGIWDSSSGNMRVTELT